MGQSLHPEAHNLRSIADELEREGRVQIPEMLRTIAAQLEAPRSFDEVIHQDEDGLFKTIEYCLGRLREKYDAAKRGQRA